jgi:hypothetical protein
MLNRILKGLAILGAAAVVVALSMTWVVVSVFIPADGLRLWIPAPVVLAQGAVSIVDPPELHKAIPVEGEHARLAAAALRELETVDDAELVRIESAEETVVIRLQEGRIHVEVDNATDHVRVHAPVREVREFLEGFEDGPVEPFEVFRLARSLPSGPLVEVDNPEAQVSIRVW